MASTKSRVSLSFAKGADHLLKETARTVLANLYLNPFFDAPPVSYETLDAAVRDFEQAIVEQSQGGIATTAEKRDCRRELVALLQDLALYVQGKSAHDLPELLSSGFHAMRHNTSQSELPKPLLLGIKQGVSGETRVTVGKIDNARCYQVEVALVDESGIRGGWTTGGIHTGSRNIPVAGLIPGRMYFYRVRAIGGSTGHSDWSDAVAHRVI